MIAAADTCAVPLVARNGSIRAHALVDPADVEMLASRTWRLHSRGYACAEAATVLMHREIMGLDAGDPREVDHKNGDHLDNRRSNLRIVKSRSEQLQNQRPRRGARSRFRGVHLHRKSGRWVARCQIRGKVHSLGHHDSEEVAAAVAAAFRREHMPYSMERTS